MDQQHHKIVQSSFAKQAEKFGTVNLNLANRDYLQWMVSRLNVNPESIVLDVAAGTGHLSRAIAPFVRKVIALDATLEMIAQGRREAAEANLKNISFQRGYAEHIPYVDNSFDLVTCRFAIHHFPQPDLQAKEMVRVCRDGGKVTLIDIVSPDNPNLAESYNNMERMRDPSHVRALPIEELKSLLTDNKLQLEHSESKDVEVNVNRWLSLTSTDEETSKTIITRLEKELANESTASGLRPFKSKDQLMFLQTWVIVSGIKSDT
jgi:ubiquinone/menaquinone biosynthesis C-methylase UbiE